MLPRLQLGEAGRLFGGTRFLAALDVQTLHPYFDNAKFFDARRVAARAISGAELN